MAGKLAVGQLNGSDTDYVNSMLGMSFFKGEGIGTIVLLVLLAVIWFKPLMNLKKVILPAVAIFIMALSLSPTKSFAYYDVLDRDEYIEIGPNQTAFLIPLVGDNANSQAQFLSK